MRSKILFVFIVALFIMFFLFLLGMSFVDAHHVVIIFSIVIVHHVVGVHLVAIVHYVVNMHHIVTGVHHGVDLLYY